MMPGMNYSIYINDTRSQPAVTHGIKTVRYISDIKFNIPLGTHELELDIPLVKYFNLSGRVYYDENENNIADSYELDKNVTIFFKGPMEFSIISNSSGGYHKFVLEGKYSVEIDNEGFLSVPKVANYSVSLENTTFDIIEVPIKVKVYGITFYDVKNDLDYNPDEEIEKAGEKVRDKIIGGAIIEFTKKILVEPEPGVPATPHFEDVEKSTIKIISNAITGEYLVNLDPGEYGIYVYNKY